jgi:hypothetical protein
VEKISSILGASPRVKAVDLDAEHPVRPGAPAFGRKEGTTSSQRDKVTISPAAKEAAFAETMAAHDPRKDESSKMRVQNTDKFFESKQEQFGESVVPPEAQIARAVTSEFNNVRAAGPTRGAQASTAAAAEGPGAGGNAFFPGAQGAQGAQGAKGTSVNRFA